MAIIETIVANIDRIYYRIKNLITRVSEVFDFTYKVIRYICSMFIAYVADKLSYIPLFRLIAGTDPELDRAIRLWMRDLYLDVDEYINKSWVVLKFLFDKSIIEVAGTLKDDHFLKWYAGDDKLLTVAGNIARERYSKATLNIIKAIRNRSILFNGTWGIGNPIDSIFRYALIHSDVELVRYLFQIVKNNPTGRVIAIPNRNIFVPSDQGNDLSYTLIIMFEALNEAMIPGGMFLRNVRHNDVKDQKLREIVYQEVHEFLTQYPNIPRGSVIIPIYNKAFIPWEFRTGNINNLDRLMSFDLKMNNPSREPSSFLDRFGKTVDFMQENYSYYKDRPAYRESSLHILNKVIDLLKRGNKEQNIGNFFANFDNLEEAQKNNFADYIKGLSFMVVHANSGKVAEKLLEQIPSNHIKNLILQQSTALLAKICDNDDKFNNNIELLTFLHAKKLDVTKDDIVLDKKDFPFVYRNEESVKNFDLQVRVMRKVMDAGISYDRFCNYLNIYQKLSPVFMAGFEKNHYKDDKSLPIEIRYICYNYTAGMAIPANVVEALYEIFEQSNLQDNSKNKFEKVADRFIKALTQEGRGVNI